MHIAKVAHALMAKKSMPHYYWDEVLRVQFTS